ncbi:F0F1 ATP synthase subunit epsilon [Parabacteroides chinchillae]|uniref:F-type H+-transporting ATPase subunit epsilon n=1 Tax=Parabacteroides chinchillae TaxID=871327 RepID=A0A8G2F1M2_9BACT|nr:F0F1 ATP synthase subunit epsilon [Parabacteroides chinchillae]SEF94928.1 F-type H+-transporting ATPase subunit epsilon [Parabacteroides chinchillae]
MRLEIVSPNGMLFNGEIEDASFPGLAGSFDVLPNHAPMIAALGEGVIRYEDGIKRYEQKIRNGFIEISNNILSVCVE